MNRGEKAILELLKQAGGKSKEAAEKLEKEIEEEERQDGNK